MKVSSNKDKATNRKKLRQVNSKNVEKRTKLDEVIEGCLRNDRRAQEELFKLYFGKMMAVCLRYISDKDTAQEVLQEGFIKVFDKLSGYDSKGSFDGWIRRIVANTAIDHIRKSKKDPMLSDNDNDFVQGTSNPMVEQEEIELTSIKGEIAMEAIQQLSPGYRAVFNLYVLEDYSHKEIAELLGISEGTSKSNLAKAKMNLQTILTKKFMNLH